MPLKIAFLRPPNWSRLKPYYQSTITAVKGLREFVEELKIFEIFLLGVTVTGVSKVSNLEQSV